MIDTDKYEGHEKKLRLDEGSRDITMINDAGQEFTVKGGHLRIVVPPNKPVGPWNEWKGGLLFDLGEKAVMGNTCLPTARLMADAPLLLAEVKRLREIIVKINMALMDEDASHLESVELIEAILSRAGVIE